MEPLKGAVAQLHVLATTATEDARTGDVVVVERDDGGITTDSSFSYQARYLAISQALPYDQYNRTPGGRSLDALGEYRNVASIGTLETTLSLDNLRARRLELSWAQVNFNSDASTATANRIDLDDYTPQILAFNDGLPVNTDVVEADVRVDRERKGDRIQVIGGAGTDLQDDEVNVDIDTSHDVNWTTTQSHWKAKVPRSVGVFYIDISNPEYTNTTRYTLVVERNQPYTSQFA